MREKIEKIADFYGMKHQSERTYEELGELIIALSKFNLSDYRPEPVGELLDNLAEEIADVEIMLDQIKYLAGIREKSFGYKFEKVERQLQRMEKERGAENVKR